MNKKIIIPTIALVALLGAIAIGTVNVSAQSPVYSNLVAKIAERFNLPEADVQKVVDEVRGAHMEELKANWENRLSGLVTSGKITEEQKAAILAKHVELEKEFADLKNLSAEERKAKKSQIFEELKKWAADNNLNLGQSELFGLRGGFGKGFHFGFRPENSQ